MAKKLSYEELEIRNKELEKRLDESKYKLTQKAFQRTRKELEQRVEERTAKLKKMNEQLKEEIEGRKKAEEALRESEERYRDLFEKAPAVYMELDIEGCITSVNIKEREMFGYTSEEMVSQFFWNFTPDKEDAQKTIKAKMFGKIPPDS